MACLLQIKNNKKYYKQTLTAATWDGINDNFLTELTGDVQKFQTAGTTETQATLVGISHTGSYTSFDSAGEWEITNNYSCVNTDYSDSSIKIILQLHYK